jgi:hypothetical protein
VLLKEVLWKRIDRAFVQVKKLVLDFNHSEADTVESINSIVAVLDSERLQVLQLASTLCLLQLPANLGEFQQLQTLCLMQCSMLTSLPDTIVELKLLEKLVLAFCKSITSLPSAIVNLTELKLLNLERTTLRLTEPQLVWVRRNIATNKCKVRYPEGIGGCNF